MKFPPNLEIEARQGLRLQQAFQSIGEQSVREEIVVFAETKARELQKMVSPLNESPKKKRS